jgi:hypothetical protein
MTDFHEARAKASKYVDEMAAKVGMELAIDDDASHEEPWCWVFGFNSRAFLETGSISHALTGNGPIVVEKDGGAVHILVSAFPIEDQLEGLRRGR